MKTQQSAFEHACFGFPVVEEARIEIRVAVGVPGGDVPGVDVCAVFCKFMVDMAMEVHDLGEGETLTNNSRLIGDHHDFESEAIEGADGFGGAVAEVPLLREMHEIVVDVDGAVAVEEENHAGR